MKFSSSRDFRTLISRSFAMLAVVIFIVAMLTPNVLGQVVVQENLNNSPLGIACAVENAVNALLQ